ncbi:hypothetical protein KR018_001931, partial [Drosophila ironensis]
SPPVLYPFCSMSPKDYAGLVGCSTLAFVLYLNTFNAGFVYDDRRAILGNEDVTGAGPWTHLLRNDFWGTRLTDSGSHGSWRPLCVLSFRLNFLAAGLTPFGYHLVNVLLHSLATGLVVLVGRIHLPSRAGVLAAGLLFAVHPVHSEAVAGLVGRADLLACVCSLLAYLAYQRHMDNREWGSLLLTVLLALAGLLCKETAITALLLCGTCDVLAAVGRGHDKHEITWKSLPLAGSCSLLCPNKSSFFLLQHRLRSLSILSVSLACALYCRLSVLPGPSSAFAAADNPAAHEASWRTRTLTFLYLPVENLRLLLWPQRLSFDWGMEAIPRIRTLWDGRNLLSAGFYAFLGRLLWQSRRGLPAGVLGFSQVAGISLPLVRRLGDNSCHTWLGNRATCDCHHQLAEQPWSHSGADSYDSELATSKTKTGTGTGRGRRSRRPLPEHPLMCVAFVVLPFLPASNLLFYVGFVMAERILYLPSVGYCLLVGFGFARIWQQLPAHSPRPFATRLLLLCTLGILLGAHGLRSFQRNREWRDEEQLFRSAIAVNPPKALGNLGSVLSAHGRYEEAKAALTMAIGFRPSMADAHFNLGVVHQNQMNFSSAVTCYRKAIQLRPQMAVAYLNLGTSLVSLGGDPGEAMRVLRAGSRLEGQGVRDRGGHEAARYTCYLQLGSLLRSQGQLKEAAEMLSEALATLGLQNQNQRIELHLRLGEVYAELEDWQRAEEQQMMALHLQPQQGAAYVTYGQTLARNVSAKKPKAGAENIKINNKLCCLQGSRLAEAEMWFKRALQLAPLEPSSHHHYADFLEQQERHQEALSLRLRAASLAPADYALQSAVADALRLLNRLVEAELWYRRAVTLQPLAAHAHANLGAILQMRGRRREAVECYHRALELQPGHAISRANLEKINLSWDNT